MGKMTMSQSTSMRRAGRAEAHRAAVVVKIHIFHVEIGRDVPRELAALQLVLVRLHHLLLELLPAIRVDRMRDIGMQDYNYSLSIPSGAVFDEFPYHQSIIHEAEAEYEELPGFEGDIGDCRREADLPAEARTYLEALSDHAGAPVKLVGVGPDRDQVVWMGEETPELKAAA